MCSVVQYSRSKWRNAADVTAYTRQWKYNESIKNTSFKIILRQVQSVEVKLVSYVEVHLNRCFLIYALLQCVKVWL